MYCPVIVTDFYNVLAKKNQLKSMYLLGYDLEGSSIKAALINAATVETVKVVQYPETEMNIISVQNGWAEQEPETWWENLCIAAKKLLQNCEVLP
jgi:xylulokinase